MVNSPTRRSGPGRSAAASLPNTNAASWQKPRPAGYGELGGLLRREGLYHSNLATWHRERDAGTLTDKQRGPRPNPEAAEMKRLQQENARLKRQLEQAEAIIEAPKKLAALLDRLNGKERK